MMKYNSTAVDWINNCGLTGSLRTTIKKVGELSVFLFQNECLSQ